MPSPSTEQSRWFSDEVHPHEPSLKAYLRSSFPTVRDVDDVVQESYLRIWKARAGQPIQSAKAFLFRIARNLALDLVRRDRISPVIAVGDSAVEFVADSRPDAAETASAGEKIRLLAEAVATLPDRCREIVILRKLDGLPQREVAARLGISEKTVEEQVSRGVRRCERYLRRHGINDLYES
jgi:RNA polymerase sigma-70 factor (ECF subfamily)